MKKSILIVKTGAAGDVLRTTFILEDLSKEYNIYWLTDPLCTDLINPNLAKIVTNINEIKNQFFYKIFSLEEDKNLILEIQSKLQYEWIVGCYCHGHSYDVKYTPNNSEWFDMSIISEYGIEKANKLKLQNKKTFQELIAPIFNLEFTGQKYNTLKYNTKDAIIKGDIAIAKTAGNKWPNKNWAHYDELKVKLEKIGYIVNYLPNRSTIKEHIADIAAHKLVICGDSLPMHIATALEIPSIALFTCTSPIEIYDYNLITKVVSSKLKRYYYQREFNENCVKSISLNKILNLIKI